MSRLLLVAFALVLLPSCSPSIDDSCAAVCKSNAICQEGSDEKACVSLCKDLAKDDDAYAEAIARQGECYEENASYYDDPKGVCLAIEGGACNTIQNE